MPASESSKRYLTIVTLGGALRPARSSWPGLTSRRPGLAQGEIDRLGALAALIRLGVRAPKGPPVEPEYYARWRDIFAEPYEVDAYDFGNSHIHEKVMKLVPSAMKRLSSFQPAKEIIFLDRMVGGHYGNLRTIGATVPLRELLDPYLDAFAPEKLLAGV